MDTHPLFRIPHPRRLSGWTVLAGLLVLSVARAEAAEPLFFMQLTDPQFGMFTDNANFHQETANFEFAIATANRLKPAFVVITGDLINKTGDAAQTDEYLRIVGKLDRSIPLYHLPGNHDIGNDPTPESIAAYVARYGPDHYSFRCGPVLGLVLNSCLVKSGQGAPQQTEQQEAWLKAELAKAKQDNIPHVIVFQHHPWFTAKVDEADAYDNLPLQERRPHLDLLRQYGVTHVFAGHYHANVTTTYDSLELVATGAIGKPLRNDVSGMRIVIVRDTGLEHRYYHLGEIPPQIDLSPPKQATTAAAQ
jgi:serine/threonine-protein phosphatase CPPED1